MAAPYPPEAARKEAEAGARNAPASCVPIHPGSAWTAGVSGLRSRAPLHALRGLDQLPYLVEGGSVSMHSLVADFGSSAEFVGRNQRMTTRSVTGGDIGGAVLWNCGRAPSGDRHSPFGPWGEPVDNAPGRCRIDRRGRGRVAHRLPPLSRLSPTIPQDLQWSLSRIEQASRSALRDHWSCKVPSDAEGNGMQLKTLLNRV